MNEQPDANTLRVHAELAEERELQERAARILRDKRSRSPQLEARRMKQRQKLWEVPNS